jgi:hypothetical protein
MRGRTAHPASVQPGYLFDVAEMQIDTLAERLRAEVVNNNGVF